MKQWEASCRKGDPRWMESGLIPGRPKILLRTHKYVDQTLIKCGFYGGLKFDGGSYKVATGLIYLRRLGQFRVCDGRFAIKIVRYAQNSDTVAVLC